MFLSCSKTLTEGVNFPIYLVIIANTKTDKEHSDKLTYQQICGRAGRSEYNKDGESIIIDDGSKKGLENYNADSIGKLTPSVKVLLHERNIMFFDLTSLSITLKQ